MAVEQRYQALKQTTQREDDMKRTLFCLAFFAFACPIAAHTLTLTTESYPPYSFRDKDGKLSGSGTEQIEIIAAKAGVDYKILLMPWARAIALAETQPWHCAFATARTAEREARFKWVEPLLIDRNILIAKKEKAIKVANLDEAKAYSVGTQREDYTETLLRKLGFPRIDISANITITLNKLINGRIDMMPMSESSFHDLRDNNAQFEAVTLLSEQRLGLACNKSVPDEVISALQAQLDILIANGEQNRIYQKYGLPPRP
jgi:polar amino acid transport system substrate-binding protein